MKSRFNLPLSLIILLFFIGCSTFPNTEINKANQLLVKAEKEKADLYMSPAYRALKDSLFIIEEELKEEKEKYFKDYAALQERLQLVIEDSEKMLDVLPARKRLVRAEAEIILSSLKTELHNAGDLIRRAVNVVRSEETRSRIIEEVESVKISAQGLEKLLENEPEYADVLEELVELRRTVVDINTELTEAIIIKKPI